MDPIQHYQNQLLFNMHVPAAPINMAARFHRPDPISFEKLGCTLPLPQSAQPPKPAFQFSAVSEDKLSMAMQLAKRDLKKQKEEEASIRLSRQMEKKARKSRSARAKPIVLHGQESQDNTMRKPGDRNTCGKQAIAMRERKLGRPLKSVSGQSKRPKPLVMPDGVLHVRQDPTSMPARSLSPPTRDTDPYEDRLCQQDNKTLNEIHRLRHDIAQCLGQIKHVQQLASQGKFNFVMHRQPGEEDLPDAEVLQRHRAHAEEQERSMARQLYTVQQQVRQIQEQLGRTRPGSLKTIKRSQLLGRLAAAHRGAVKVLHTFVTQLQQFDLQKGLPRSHRELEVLMRQLSLCCAQLEVAGESGVPDSVLNLIKDVAELNSLLEKEVLRSPPRPATVPHTHGALSKSPVHRELFHDKHSQPVGKKHFSKAVSKGAKDDLVILPRERRNIGVKTVERLSRDIHPKEDASPERQVALRQGIQALLRAAEPMQEDMFRTRHPPVPPLKLPTSPSARGKRPSYAWDIPARQAQVGGGKKGLLLPSKLQKQRQKQGAQQRVVINEARYTLPTVSSQLKITQPEDRPQPSSPPRTPRQESGRSPRREKSPRRVAWHDDGFDKAHHEAARQVWLDKEAMKHYHYVEPEEPSPKERVDHLRKQFGHTPEWVVEAEDRIKSQLHPLLEKAKEFSEMYESLQHHSIRHPSYVKKNKHNSVEVNADGLADMILGDLLEETLHEVESTIDDEECSEEARKAIAAPTIENLMQRMQEMELEQNEIRRRWATIVYEEEENQSARTRYFDASMSEQPGTPPPIEVINSDVGVKRRSSVDLTDGLPPRNSEDNVILFTKPRQKPRYKGTSLHLSNRQAVDSSDDEVDVANLQKRLEQSKTSLFLSPESVAHIHDHRQKYVAHLKQSSTQAVGKFNPWQLVEEISNEILKECLDDVCQELDQINSDIADHVYQSEFSLVPGNTGLTSNKSVGNLPAGKESSLSLTEGSHSDHGADNSNEHNS